MGRSPPFWLELSFVLY
jgi:Domain of unknown function (DUF4265)